MKGAWKTSDELDFLKRLGGLSEAFVERRLLLKCYLEAAKFRKDWGQIDRQVVILAAATLLAGA